MGSFFGMGSEGGDLVVSEKVGFSSCSGVGSDMICYVVSETSGCCCCCCGSESTVSDTGIGWSDTM